MFEFFQEKAAVCGNFKDFLVSFFHFPCVSVLYRVTLPTAAKGPRGVSVSEQTPFNRAGYARQCGFGQKFPWDHLFLSKAFLYILCASVDGTENKNTRIPEY